MMLKTLFPILSFAATAWAQSFTGSIVGEVSDVSGGMITGAQVTARNTDTGQTRFVQTGAAGQYVISALSPGNYSLEVEATGFRRFKRDGLRVEVLASVRVDVVLAPGSVVEAVTVTGESPLLETNNASVGQVIDNARIQDLPLNGRNSMALVALTAGVQPARPGNFGGQPTTDGTYAQANFSVNSGLQSQSESFIDGVPNNVYLWNAPAFVPSVAGVEEFKVQTSGYSAEFGHAGGGIVNMTTKSGTNEFRGSLFHFLRNDNLDANNFFNNRSGQPRPSFTFNQFGGAIGGPVILPNYRGKDKTFFFANYEGFRQKQARTVLFTLPQTEQRQGDFSSTRNPAGQLITVHDPLTVRPAPGVGSGFVRDQFPGNRIPASRFDAVSRNAINFWAPPNLPGDGPAKINNFVANPSVAAAQNQFMGKLDHIFNEKHRTFGRYIYNRQQPGQTDVFNTVPGALLISATSIGNATQLRAQSAALEHTWIVSPTLVGSFRYGATRQQVWRYPSSLGLDLTSIGFSERFNNEVQIRTLPTFNLQGFQSIGEGGNVLIQRADLVHSAQASFTKTFSKQNLRFGFQFRSYLFNDTRAPFASGTFVFNQGFTQMDPLRASAVSGHSVASFLLGHPNSAAPQYAAALSLNQQFYAGFIQDDYRITRNLTLNFGLRWDVETPRTERHNRLSSFDALAVSPIAEETRLDLKGGLRFLGVDGFPRTQTRPDRNNFAPRFGFAWRIRSNLVARGGYGIFFHQTVGQGGLVGNGDDGFGTTNAMLTTPDGGITPGDRLNDPFPRGMNLPTGSSLGLRTLLGQPLAQWSRIYNTPYSQQYSFGLQLEIPGWFLVDGSFVGRHAIGVPIRLPINQMRPEFLELQSALLTQVPNPFRGIITTGALAPATVPRNRLLRPFPHFDNINMLTPIAHESYNSAQLRVERRLKGGASILGSYTFAKSLTNAGGGLGSPFGFNTPSVQNVYDLRGDRSLSPLDVSQRLVVSYLWELPFGKGRALLGNAGGFLQKVVSGWQFNGIASFQTGYPLAIMPQANQVSAFSGARPDIREGATATLPSDQRSLARWFDTSVFLQPPQFQFGGVSRTLPSTRGPGMQNFDLVLAKNTQIRERLSLQLRWEAFNAFNRANFDMPGTVMGNPQFGVINGTDPARVMQVVLQLRF